MGTFWDFYPSPQQICCDARMNGTNTRKPQCKCALICEFSARQGDSNINASVMHSQCPTELGEGNDQCDSRFQSSFPWGQKNSPEMIQTKRLWQQGAEMSPQSHDERRRMMTWVTRFRKRRWCCFVSLVYVPGSFCATLPLHLDWRLLCALKSDQNKIWSMISIWDSGFLHDERRNPKTYTIRIDL